MPIWDVRSNFLSFNHGSHISPFEQSFLKISVHLRKTCPACRGSAAMKFIKMY